MPPLASQSPDAPEVNTLRPNRAALLAFTSDAQTEHALREGLSEILFGEIEFRHAGIRAAIAILAGMATPLTLIVDLSGEENPLVALSDLRQVVEPNVRILVVGDQEGVNFYRQVTRDLGASEYLHKPLTRDVVARHFGPLLNAKVSVQGVVQGGRLVTVTGVRGGVGASTVAANLSWYLGVEEKRHTVLLDTDLHRGVCAMLLGARPDSALRTALEAPERIDKMFVERAAHQLAERLHILAGREDLDDQLDLPLGGAAWLSEELRRRYNFVVTDLPFTGQPLHRDLMHMAHQRVFVMMPTLACIRDTLRLLAIPNGPVQPRRAIVILNRAGMAGGLEKRRIMEGLQMTPDIVIPDIQRVAERAANLGKPVMQEHGLFRNAMESLAREVGFNSHRVEERPANRLWFQRRK
jgi:pilus assembly protein CpaE